ncbi:MAG: TolC family protein [Candidatus Korobacteraceae bacterium]
MCLARFVECALRKTITLGIAVLLVTAGFAQNATAPSGQSNAPIMPPMPQAPAPQHNAHLYSDKDYSKPAAAFPNVIASYTSRRVPPPNLSNSARTDQLFHDGKMYLSINDAVAMALENNLDIVLQRYNLSIADTDLLRTQSGTPALGVNAGVVQGTLGGLSGSTSAGGTGSAATGATGTGAGGTQTGVGGAGAGAGGIVFSTLGGGPPLQSYDPVITGTIQGERATTPQANIFFSGGLPTAIQNTNTYNFGYSQAFSTGTLASVTFNNSRITTNVPFDLYNPQITPSFRFQLTQHLLQGFGFDPNLRWIRIARNTRENGDVVFRQQIIATVSQVENIYWDLVTAYEAVRVNERALQLAQKTQSDDEEEIRIGTLAPITLVQAKSGVATANQNLITSQTQLQLQQLLMKNAITKNMGDPILADATVIPTDTLQFNEQQEIRPVQDLIQEALQARPEIATQRINLTNAEISRKALKNALRPTLDVYAFYGASALAGDQTPLLPPCDFQGAIPGENCLPPGTIPRSGYPNAFHDLFNSTGPDKGIGVNLNIVLRNRAAQSEQVRSELEYRQSQVGLQQIENTITIQVRQAQFSVQQNYAALQAAIAARDFAKESLSAEQKKFGYGASTPTLVLQASSNLTQAESNVLNAAANYEKSKVQLDQATAETLTKLGIDIADAESGQVKRAPAVKGVVPANVEELTTPTAPYVPPQGSGVAPNPSGAQPQSTTPPPPGQEQPEPHR